jgi:hypothetical protein
MAKSSMAVFHLAAFGSWWCRRNEICLHSHLGEGFAGNWLINKCLHILFGQQFIWAPDCYTIKFILSYDGTNPAILCLMRLMCWDVEIIQQTIVLLMQIIGPTLEVTFVLNRSSKNTFSSPGHSVHYIQRL